MERRSRKRMARDQESESDRKNGGDGKAEVSKPRRRGARSAGKLKSLLRMPVDVFVEVASYLQPLDVLHLARSTRFFREILMSKQSRPVWRAALANTDGEAPPECPPDLSEPHYVALLFDKGNCMACGRRTTVNSDYAFRTRICKNCPVARLQKGRKILRDMRRELGIAPALWKTKKDYVLFSMVPCQDVNVHSYVSVNLLEHNDPKRWGFLAEKLFDPKSLSSAVKRFYHLLVANGVENAASYVVEEQNKVVAILQHALRVKEWKYRLERAQASRERELADAFRKDVYAKLRELGYTDEEFTYIDHSCGHVHSVWSGCICQERVLTPRIWNNLRPTLERQLQAIREPMKKEKRDARRRKFSKFLTDEILQVDAGTEQETRLFGLSSVAELECEAVTQFLDKVSNNETYDRWAGVPEEDWDILRKGGIWDALDDRKRKIAKGLKNRLLEAIDRTRLFSLPREVPTSTSIKATGGYAAVTQILPIPEPVLRESESPVVPLRVLQDIDIFHPAAFFGHTQPFEDGMFMFDKVQTYADVLDCISGCSRYYKDVTESVEGSEQAASSSMARIGNAKKHYWLGDATAISIAIALLESISTAKSRSDPHCFNAHDEGVKYGTYLTMDEILEKGKVFVCMCCPEECRMKRGWTELVDHFYAEAFYANNAATRQRVGYLDLPFPLINAHDSQIANIDASNPRILAIESADFTDGPCLLGHRHSHDDQAAPLYHQYVCTMCIRIGGSTEFVARWRTCVESHLNARHGKVTVDEEDVVLATDEDIWYNTL